MFQLTLHELSNVILGIFCNPRLSGVTFSACFSGHQNGSTANSVSAASASMAAAAQFYHQAAAASAAADPLTSCSQPGSASSQPLPDIPRYPWMSITGRFDLQVLQNMAL